ncbi:polyketide synthase dehydratase domain-containing protein [Bradyrhizobium manausense]|uniref:polyketide synthase dehydratase domain-containing protein n=1 Tax=Bradyrhizobium manausense TaxID=989370 RepID=UPI0009F929A9
MQVPRPERPQHGHVPRSSNEQDETLRFNDPYLAQHQIGGEAIVPGASIILAVLQAARSRMSGGLEVRDVVFERALPAGDAVHGVRCTFRARSPSTFTFELISAQENSVPPVRYASGVITTRETARC